MSKLTNWIDKTDSLDIQGIVDKYEQDLTSGAQKNCETTNINNKEEEIWCGSLDEFATKKLQPTENTVLETKPNILNENTKPMDSKPVDNTSTTNSNKTLIFGNFNTNEPPKPTAPSQSTPPPLFNIEKQANDNQIKIENNKTIEFGVINKPEVESEKKPAFKDDIIKKHLEEMNQIKSKKEQELKNESFLRTKPQVEENVNFEKPDTRLFSCGESKPKFNTVTIVDKDKEEESTSKFLDKDGKPFSVSSAFIKQIEENDFKTVKFQPTASQLAKEADNLEKMDNFTKRLTKIFFNETIKAENLDLTKELNHAKGISIDGEALKEKRGFFNKFKKKNKENNK